MQLRRMLQGDKRARERESKSKRSNFRRDEMYKQMAEKNNDGIYLCELFTARLARYLNDKRLKKKRKGSPCIGITQESRHAPRQL